MSFFFCVSSFPNVILLYILLSLDELLLLSLVLLCFSPPSLFAVILLSSFLSLFDTLVTEVRSLSNRFVFSSLFVILLASFISLLIVVSSLNSLLLAISLSIFKVSNIRQKKKKKRVKKERHKYQLPAVTFKIFQSQKI